MNLSVYLNQQLVSKISLIAKKEQMSKNAIIREAIEEWITHHHPNSHWPSNFFDFEGIKETPDFSAYRKDLAPQRETTF